MKRRLALPPLALALTATLASSCGPSSEPKAPASLSCATLDACRDALTKAGAEADAARARPLAEAVLRLGEGTSEPLAVVARAAREAGEKKLSLVIGASGDVPGAITTRERAVPEAAVVALATGLGARHVLFVGDAGALTERFPVDALAPFVPELPGLVRSAGAQPAAQVTQAATIERVFAHLGAFDYVSAAREASALETSLEGLPEPATVRARYALSLVRNAALMLEAPRDAKGAEEKAAQPAPSPLDSPYTDFMRVELATERAVELERRRATLVPAVPERLRALFLARYPREGVCADPAPLPAFTEPAELWFAGRLATSLRHVGARTDDPSRLPITEWYRAYEQAARGVEARGLFWARASDLLYERGASAGVPTSGTPTYRAVTAMAQKHLKAMRALERAEPARFAAHGATALFVSPGAVSDEALLPELVELARATTADKMGAAKTAGEVFEAGAVAFVAGMSLPGSVQGAHYTALQGALTAKLRGDLASEHGWGVAGLHAADALVRLVADLPRDLGGSADRIARALGKPAKGDEKLPVSELAPLAIATARYVVLAEQGQLDLSAASKDAGGGKHAATRAAAKAALRDAFASLGDAPAGPVVDDLAELADGLVAALVVSVQRKPAASAVKKAPSTCSDDAAPDPAVRRALEKLGDVRRRLLSSPSLKKDTTRFGKRARLAALVLSDALDTSLAYLAPQPKSAAKKQVAGGGKNAAGKVEVRFFKPREEAEAAVREGLEGVDVPGLADLLSGAYGVARGVLSSSDTGVFVENGGLELIRLLGGAAKLLGKGSGSTSFLSAIASLGGAKVKLPDLALGYAKTFFEKGEADRGDAWLLVAMSLASYKREPPSEEALRLAEQHKSRIAWVLAFARELSAVGPGRPVRPESFEAGMKGFLRSLCSDLQERDLVALYAAIRDHAAGKRAEARLALDRWLESAEERGLDVPRARFQFEEGSTQRLLNGTLELSFARGFLSNSSSFQVGFGFSSGSGDVSRVKVEAPSRFHESVRRDTGKLYVYVAALASTLHLLDDDKVRAARAARRAIDAMVHGVRLGSVTLRDDARSPAWPTDARSLMLLSGQLAAEQGMPFLAGDLLTIVKQSFGARVTPTDLATLVDEVDDSLKALGGTDVGKRLDKVRERAREAAKQLLSPHACEPLGNKRERWETPGCDDYPMAVALRVADSVSKLPRLKQGPSSCDAMRALDGFLGPAQAGTYDPDAFTQAVTRLFAEGRDYDGAALLTRQRRDTHCSPALVSAARAVAAKDGLGPEIGSDLLSVSVNCNATRLTPELESDLLALDARSSKLGDLSRNLSVLVFTSNLSVHHQSYDTLAKLTERPGFLDRWMGTSPRVASTALLVSRAAFVLAGRSGAEPGEATYGLLCKAFPGTEQASVCEGLKALAAETRPTEKKALAKRLLETTLKP